jgi:hypothetical protein
MALFSKSGKRNIFMTTGIMPPCQKHGNIIDCHCQVNIVSIEAISKSLFDTRASPGNKRRLAFLGIGYGS